MAKRSGWKKFTAEQIALIKQEYSQGSSVASIARLLGDTKQRVKSKIYAMGQLGELHRGIPTSANTAASGVERLIPTVPTGWKPGKLGAIRTIYDLPNISDTEKLYMIGILARGIDEHRQNRSRENLPHSGGTGQYGSAGNVSSGQSSDS